MSPQTLTPYRLQLHYAVQLIAAVGMATGDPKPDGSQMTLTWDDELNGYVGAPIPGTQIQVALLPGALTSLVLQARQPVATLVLAGHTLLQALAWHEQVLAPLGVTAPLKLLTYPADDFPDHPLGHGAVFTAEGAAGRAAIAAYYAQTLPLLEAVIAANATASPPYIWPHHFDMATLMTYPNATATQYLGVGLSPGDATYAEPYWYVSPYPYPTGNQLPPLPVGRWHTHGWVGAVLTATEGTDAATVRTFMQTAIATAQDLLQVH